MTPIASYFCVASSALEFLQRTLITTKDRYLVATATFLVKCSASDLSARAPAHACAPPLRLNSNITMPLTPRCAQ